ncbi:hypothetical protein J5U22_01641 [Saccharolobus shibatae]|uniref:Uncharacterized protein n=1 Tax=Saccharolobus shibatae TaxID=2286 RepID=A0A8F5C0W8_9CREN|nr:hypothetical protein J5U22_01641 [Saccharolobus shibatae]
MKEDSEMVNEGTLLIGLILEGIERAPAIIIKASSKSD